MANITISSTGKNIRIARGTGSDLISLDAISKANTAQSAVAIAMAQSNTAMDRANSAMTTANTAAAASTDVTARVQANTARDTANAAFAKANTANTESIVSAFAQANTARDHANASFGQANTDLVIANLAFDKANTGVTIGSAAFGQANTGRDHANVAFAKANAALPNTDGVTFSGNLRVTGTLTIGSNSVVISNNTVSAEMIDVCGVNVFSTMIGAFSHANASFGQANSATTIGSAAFGQANTSAAIGSAAFGQANTTLTAAQAAFAQANTDLFLANLAFDKANTVISVGAASNGWSNTISVTTGAASNGWTNTAVAPAFTQANTALTTGQAAFAQANTDLVIANLAFDKANTAAIIASAAFDTANSSSSPTPAFNQANTALTTGQAAFAQANTATTIGSAAFGGANAKVASVSGTSGQLYSSGGTTPVLNLITTAVTSSTYGGATQIPVIAVDPFGRLTSAANVAVQGMDYPYANSIGAAANGWANTVGTTVAAAANGWANTAVAPAFAQANTALTTGQAAFAQANARYSTSGGPISGDVSIAGNLTVTGSSTTFNVSSIVVNDPVIFLANSNYTTDLLDIGFVGHYNDGTNAHTGFIRDANTKEYYVFSGYTPEILANNTINIADPSFALSNIYASYVKANLVGNTITVSSSATVAGLNTVPAIQAAFGQANSGVTIGSAAYGQANTDLLIANLAFDKGNTAATIASAAFGQANTAATIGSAAFSQANTGTTTAAAAFAQANTDLFLANLAFDKANTGTTTGIAAFGQANSATTIGSAAFDAANAKVSTVSGTSGQIYSSGGTTPTLNLIATGVTVTTYGGATQIPVLNVDSFGRVTVGANVAVQGMDYAYANSIGAASNTWANTVGTSVAAAANGWANTVGITVAAASNGWANTIAVSVGAASNGWTNTVTTSAVAGANAWSNTKVSSVTGTAGEIYSSGGTTPVLNLITTGVTAGTYGNSTIIPVFTVDTRGRMSSVSNVTIAASSGGNQFSTVANVSAASVALQNLYFDLTTGGIFGYINDGDTSQLVELGAGSGVSDTSPLIANLAFDKANSATTIGSAAFGAANTVLSLNGSPSANLTVNGPKTNTFVSAGTTTATDLVYLSSTSKWALADADAAATAGSVMLALSLESKTADQAMDVAMPGSFIRNDAWNWTPGVTLYVSTTAGAITNIAPSGTDDVVRIIGYAMTADVIWFFPSPVYITLT